MECGSANNDRQHFRGELLGRIDECQRSADSFKPTTGTLLEEMQRVI